MRIEKFAGKACLLFVALSLCAAPVSGQPAAEPLPLIPARDLAADFAVLKRAYEELHPGLYRYNSRKQIEQNFNLLAAELNRDLTLPQAYLAFSVFLAKLKCGHSYPNFYNQPKAVAEALFRRQGRVPFYFRWLDRRMIVTRNFSAAPELAPGAEVLAINGVPVKMILARLLTVARADGSNDAKRVSYLEVTGEGNYEAFDIYFPMFFPPAGDRMELRVKPPSASRTTTTLSVPALTYEQRVAPLRAEAEARKGNDEKLWEFKFLDSQTAYLRMPTWALYNTKWDWKSYLENIFDRVVAEKTADLIIDLRGNEGGLDVGDVILGRLIRRDLRVDQFRRLVRYRKVPADLVPYLDTWDRSFENWGDAAVDLKDGFYTLKTAGGAEAKVIKASARPFAGRTFVMVDASNSSATFGFAHTFQRNRLGTLVGQPTGGNQRGINGGAFFFLRLPNSKIEIDLPLIGTFVSGAPPDAGLTPEVLFEPRAGDIARGVDTELNALRARLRAGRR